jgi:hypothetical protein
MRRGNPNRGTAINLTNFNNRRTIIATYNIEQQNFVTNWQINKRTLGSEVNPLFGSMVDPSSPETGFNVAQVRVKSITLTFDNRGNGAVPAANYRVAAMILPFTEAEINPTLSGNLLGQFGNNGVNLQRVKKIRLRVGQEFDIGRFGTGTNDTRLVIFAEGYTGNVRATLVYEVCGFPALTFNP